MLQFRYLNHSGFLVETDHHYLVFDYYPHAPYGNLEGGILCLSDLAADKPLAVFVSHAHYDHYSPEVHRFAAERPGTIVFLGDDIDPTDDATTIRPGADITMDGIRVRALRSTDQGVAFLVTVDGLTLYHAGDLNWWHWLGENEAWLRQVDAAYQGEIAKLAGESIDLAFVPVDPRLEGAALWGAQYFMKTVGARWLVPMHMWERYGICQELADHPDSAAFADRLVPITRRGQLVELLP